jgi:hypothetical protein
MHDAISARVCIKSYAPLPIDMGNTIVGTLRVEIKNYKYILLNLLAHLCTPYGTLENANP